MTPEEFSYTLEKVLNQLDDLGYVKPASRDLMHREMRKFVGGFVKKLEACYEEARKKIESQKNPPPEHSAQWEILYKKYYEQELAKLGV